MFCKRWCQPPLPGCGGDREPVSCLQSNWKHSSHLLLGPSPVYHFFLAFSPARIIVAPSYTNVAWPTIWSRIHIKSDKLVKLWRLQNMCDEGSRPRKIKAQWSECGFLEAMCTPGDSLLLGIRGDAEMLGRASLVRDREPAKMLNMYVMRLKFEC